MSAKRFAMIMTGAAAFAMAASQPAFADDQNEEIESSAEMTKGEKELAKLLEGRVAGEPKSCIRTRLNDQFRVIDETAFVYGRGKTIYVQRTAHPERIDSFDVVISRRFNASQVCKQDIIETADRAIGFPTGNVFLVDFVPYTRVDDAKDAG
ncbi:hypothetical protein FGU71_04300 [Erythrobacter insulae]|uniref:Uncharacterized protein n=1 Tax=Erythrobacter insulae TaxID=2584124 RepID=A0A547PAI1_9SPHN|nr:hypothetical protein [Erythrobacter insulae]TRD11148.1 hypothetical protein FGU71_04300 [Erythrobacter insulae]